MPDTGADRALLLAAGAIGGAALLSLVRKYLSKSEPAEGRYYSTLAIGKEDTHAFRIGAFDPKKTQQAMLSLWHDVPLCVLE